ncbi:ImmA/IrrE family metallo-endopeptidase [Streptomyces jumonjinensis]
MRLTRSLGPAVPTDPVPLFTALAASLSVLRRREVRVLFLRFPPETVSGIWADRVDHDLIVVEETAPPQHQLVILGHEIWHMHAGHRGTHADRTAAAARALAPRPGPRGAAAPHGVPAARDTALPLGPLILRTPAELTRRTAGGAPAAGGVRASGPAPGHRDAVGLREIITAVAGRTDFSSDEENAAELFGLMLATELRPWLENRPAGITPRDGLAGRIHASLGGRGALG